MFFLNTSDLLLFTPDLLIRFSEYDQCLNTVLLNELVKFNKLLVKVKDTCINLQKAVKGLVIFSPELEEVGACALTRADAGRWLSPALRSAIPAATQQHMHERQVRGRSQGPPPSTHRWS